MKLKLAPLAALATVAALAATAPAVAAPDPINTCRGGVKIEPVADGTYARSIGGTTIRITLEVNEAAKTFSFTSSRYITAVYVKGGPGSRERLYSPAVLSGSDLHAPTNASNGTYYGLSHVCFYTSGKKGGKK